MTKLTPEIDLNKKINMQVTPRYSSQGTLFFIKAKSSVNENQNIDFLIEGNNYSTLVTLYDDGFHYDENSKDGVYAGYFDSKNAPLGDYNIKTLNNNNLSSFIINNEECINILGNGEIKFLILGDYDLDELKQDALDLINKEDSLMNIEPFSSNKDKFSFYVKQENLNCEIGCKNVDTMVCCDNSLLNQNCEYDHLIVLINSDEFCGSASSYAKICAKNNQANLVLLHEIGHSFADLADEYVYEDYFDYNIGKIDKVNCGETCDKWKDLTQGCYNGCTYSNLYRSEKEDSIMYQLTPVFNIVSINQINSLLNKYSIKKNEIERLSPKSYFLNLNYNNGNVKIKDITIKPIKPQILIKDTEYKIEIKNKNKILYQDDLYIPNMEFPLPGTNSKPLYFDNIDFSITLPYYENAESIEIINDNKTIEKFYISILSDNCGNNICENFENHINCREDCSIKDNFCEGGNDPDCKSYKTKKSILILLISLILIILIIILIKRKSV